MTGYGRLFAILLIGSLFCSFFLVLFFAKTIDYRGVLRTIAYRGVLRTTARNGSLTNELPTSKVSEDERMASLLANVLDLSKDVEYAEKHARGMKTLTRLKLAKSKLQKILSMFNASYKNVTSRQITEPVNVCPDEYKGTKYGHPLYLKGFEVKNCSFGKSLDKLLTVVMVFNVKDGYRNHGKVLMSLNKYLPGVKVITAINKSLMIPNVTETVSKNTVLWFQEGETVGELWNKVIKLAKTEYTLIANDVTEFDENVRLDRLIRELESLHMSVASGAIRHSDGKWKIGCYQRAFRNYTISYFEGYDESIHECLVCDHIEGPFIIRTSEAQKLSFDGKINGNGIFEDFFIRLGEERSIVCPDSMFHVHKLQTLNSAIPWTSFAMKYDLVKLRFNPGPEILFPCRKSQKCFKSKFYVAHPCCLQELGDMVKKVMDICDAAKAICETFSGTLMASLKLGQSLPWDIDGDVGFMFHNFSEIKSASNTFKKYPITHMSRANGGYFQLNSKNWFVECWGFKKLTSEGFILNGKGQTKVLLHGNWMNTCSNPGLQLRNRYGYEYYRHAVHWRYTGGKSSWLNYKSDFFPKCNKPGDHKCVDNFRTDGNLQFSDPLP